MILKSYQAIYFLKVEDPEIVTGNILSRVRVENPEIIPGNILSQDRGF